MAPPVTAELRPAEISIAPPAAVPWPPDITIPPLLPLVACPVLKMIAPEAPFVVEPVATETWPLTPDDPEDAVFTTTDPLDFTDPLPVVRDTAPPVSAAVVSPAEMRTLPPVPELPVPMLNKMLPECPEVASPVLIVTPPELPALVVPVEKTSAPLTPLSPAFFVANVRSPDDVADEDPVDRRREPPVAPALVPP